MRKLIVAFLLVLLAIWIGFLIHQDSGDVRIIYAGHLIETSLWVFLVALIIVFCLVYLLIRFTKHTSSLGGKYQNWDKKRKSQKALDLSNKGLCDLAEGNWQEARTSLMKAAKHHPKPLINHLAAARAAHAACNYHARDEHLRHAHHSTKGAEVAVELTQATLQIDSKQWEQALATLNHLNRITPNHKHILKLLTKVYLELKDWPQLQKLLPQLKKTRIFDDLSTESIDKQIHLGLLRIAADKQDIEQLNQTWEALPKKWRQDSQTIKLYTDYLIAQHHSDEAATLIAKQLKKHWQADLVTNYGLAISSDINKQITTAEGWLEKHPREPELLLCLGRLCFAGKLLGRAEHTLNACISTSPSPEAYKMLGQVLEALSKPDEALVAYKQALD